VQPRGLPSATVAAIVIQSFGHITNHRAPPLARTLKISPATWPVAKET